MLSLAVYYSIYQSQLVGTYNPKGDLVAYRAKAVEQPTLKCECQRQSIPFRDFATPTVDVNAACGWVKADLQANVSSCRSLKLTGYCTSVRDACEQSDAFVTWIRDEFNNSDVSSTSLLQEKALSYSTTASFESNFKIGELVAGAPKTTVKAWAAANMPRIMRVLGDLATRVKAQTKKNNYADNPAGDEFAERCAASTPIICNGSFDEVNQTDYDYALNNDGNVPVNCTRADTTPSCNITMLADGSCNPECMSPECLFDGGDCATNSIVRSDPRDLRQAFSLLDAHLSADSDLEAYGTSWLDSTPDAFIDSTRRRCDDPESWLKTETILEDVDMYSSNFAGYDFSLLAEKINVQKSSGKYPKVGGKKVEFRASIALGCDQYEKELKENLFEFYTAPEFRVFLNEMRKLTGSDIFDTEPSVPYAWTCGASYYNAGDGCDCGCGTWDPDCENPSLPIFGCHSSSDVCSKAGTCQASSSGGYYESNFDYANVDVASSNVPPEWTCGAQYYGASDGCDCACGAWDPDCDDASMGVYGCDDTVNPQCVNSNGGTCQAGSSSTPGDDASYSSTPGDDASYSSTPGDDASYSSTPGDDASSSSTPDYIPAEWECAFSYYGASDGCDCACGAWDPDCDDALMSVYGCDDTVNPQCVNSNGGTCQAESPYIPGDSAASGSKRRRLQANEDYDNDADIFRNYLDPTKDLYTTTGFDFLENFAAPLMEKHTNLEKAIEKLFVDRKALEVDYEKYFTACKVSSCTYTYMSASSFAGIAAVVIGLLGGINNAMNATFKIVYSVMRGVVVPTNSGTEETEREGNETPATEEVHSSRNLV